MGTAGEFQLIGWHPVSWSKEQADQSLRRPEERGDGKTDMGLYRKACLSLPMGSAHLYQSGRYPAREQIDGYPSTKVQNVVTDSTAENFCGCYLCVTFLDSGIFGVSVSY